MQFAFAISVLQLFKVSADATMLTVRAAESSTRVALVLAVLLLARHTALCQHRAYAELDDEIQALRVELDEQQAELIDAEELALAARERVRATMQQLEYLTSIQISQRHKLRLEPYIIAPNSEMPMYADFIYLGLSAVFCSAADVADPGAPLPMSEAECEVRLHVLERSPKRASSNFSAGERVRMAIGLVVNYDYDVWTSVGEIHAHLCVVMPTDWHQHRQAALRAVARSLWCGDEIFDPARPWSSSYLMPFGAYRTRPDFGFRGNFSLNISIQAQEGTAHLPLLAATASHHVLTCSISQTPNTCDRESANVGRLSSPLLPAVQHSELWRIKPPASCVPLPAVASPTCFVAVVWTFWSDPPPYEIDWFSEVIDSSGCEVSHVLDLQMLCRGRVFSDDAVASKFGPVYTATSKVFVVSYFSKDFERGFGLMESCMLSWYLDGFDAVLVHFGDDGNSYDYRRYPRLHFVIRNHPANVTYGIDTFRNILHLGIGYKIGFWPSALRDISLRRVQPVL